MAVAQEFFDVFIRIEDVNRIYPGGFSAYLDDCADDVGYTISTGVALSPNAQVLERVPVDAVVGTSANRIEEEEIDDVIAREVPVTDRQALVKARVGQGVFRDQVLSLWSYQCSVTGCGIQEALRASHIKPWSESTDQERLDPYNGLPLLATLDALFDKHLIGFDLQGKMLISSELSKSERELLLPRKRRLLRKPDHVTARFLKEHSKLLR